MDTTLTGAVVAARCETGEGISRQAFDEIVRLHQQRIYRLLLVLLRDADAAATLTQECFLRAWRKREGYRGEASVSTWLARIAVNLARDHGRNRARSFWRRLLGSAAAEPAASAAARLPDLHPSPEQHLLAREELASVWSAVNRLPAQQRTVFLLRFADEMTLEEIAQTLELRVGTVKAHLFRAVGAVRRRLEEQG